MKKNKVFLVISISILLFTACVSYKLELVSDEDNKRNIYTQYPNYVNMLVRVTNNKITATDTEGNVIPDFSNPEYYVVGLESKNEKTGQNAFSILENDTEVKVEAGLRVVPLEELELHINILMDISGSMGECSPPREVSWIRPNLPILISVG